MGWQKDGSGLGVKRVRGMTLPQANTRRYRKPDKTRASTRFSEGRWADVFLGINAIKRARQRRRTRRAKRLAKAADRRLDTLCHLRWRNGERVIVIPTEVLRAYLKPGRHERMREDRHVLDS